jgi:hypothetical protein
MFSLPACELVCSRHQVEGAFLRVVLYVSSYVSQLKGSIVRDCEYRVPTADTKVLSTVAETPSVHGHA